MQVTVLNMTGEPVGETELPENIFAAKVNVGLMHQSVVRQLSNERQGSHKAKTRGEVNRSNRKIYKQKGTGNARHGSRKAPIFVGGGKAHAVVPRDYSKKMPKKMRHAALRSALTVKAADGNIIILDDINIDAPKTKIMQNLVDMVANGASSLVVLPDNDFAIERSTRNLTDVKALKAVLVNVRDLLGHDKVIMTLKSLEAVVGWLQTDKVAEETGYDPSAFANGSSTDVEAQIDALKDEEQAASAEPVAEVMPDVEEQIEDLKEEEQAAPDPTPAPVEVEEEAPVAEADDLKKIEGIGPKIASVLAEEGVTTFAQLAAMTAEQISELLKGKVRIANPETWPEQAALAAAGKWDELQTLQDELDGGRRS